MTQEERQRDYEEWVRRLEKLAERMYCSRLINYLQSIAEDIEFEEIKS